MASNKRGKAQARRPKQAEKNTDADAAASPTKLLGGIGIYLVLSMAVGIVSIAIGMLARGGRAVDDASSAVGVSPLDDADPLDDSARGPPMSVRDHPTDFLLFSLATAAERGDVGAMQDLGKTVLESNDRRILRKAADEMYRNDEPQLVDLSVSLLQKAYDLTFEESGSSAHSVPEKRRVIDMLGRSLEKRGDSDKAWALYNNAVEQGLWALPDQRPQHYFPFIDAGPPFGAPSDYSEAVELLERNFEVISEELIRHKRFPGKFTVDTENLAVSGRWLQADFFLSDTWHEEHVAQFPKTAKVLKEIQYRFAYKLPDAVMQMSTMVKSTRVRPHSGSGNHKVRLHLGLYVPENCGIQIANETDRWTEGRVLVVDDSYVHSVWNNSTQPRTVLIVDVWAHGISEEKKEKVRKHFEERDLLLSLSSHQGPNLPH